MVYSIEQDTFIVMSHYRNGIFINEECVHSVTAYKQEYLAKYRDLQIQETSLEIHFRGDVVNRFAGTLQREISSLQYLRKLLMI